jgi:hypothetical protein
MKKTQILIALLFSALSAMALAGDQASVYFITPQDGATVNEKFTIQFGLRGLGVAPAGVENANTGHHHLLIDMDTLPPMDLPLPKSDQLQHFGGGQTQTTITLPPGKHTLQLILGNYAHIPHNPPLMSDKITITVAKED